MRLSTSLVCLSLLLVLGASAAQAQEALRPEAAEGLRRLRESSGPSLRTVVRDGQLSWASGLTLPVADPRPRVAARRFLESYGELLGLAPAGQLELQDEYEHRGVTILRFGQSFDGHPILGAQAIVSVQGGWLRHVSTGLRPFSAASAIAPTVSATAAARAVEAASGRPAATPRAQDRAWLVLGGADEGRLAPVWIVGQRTASPPHDYRYVVDAVGGGVISRYDQFLRAEGYVWETNPVVADNVPSRVELPLLEEGATVLEGPLARSWRCVDSTGDCSGWGWDCVTCGVNEHTAFAQEDGNFLYPPEEPSYDDLFAEVQAYYHATVINRFFEDQLSFARRCAGSRTIDIFVNQHYPGDVESSANAFYGDSNGDGCGDLTLGEGTLGTGGNIDFSYDAEVIYHEFTHGVVESAGGLGCAPMGWCIDSLGIDYTAYGLNEGFADYFAVTFADDPTLGEHAGRAYYDDAMIRTADNDHICPFDMIGESHYDGQILAATGWDIREVLGAEVTDRIMLTALRDINESAGFAQVAAAIHLAAEEELAEGTITADDLTEVERIMGPEGRGITDCQRVVPLDAIPEGHHEEYMQVYTWRSSLPAGMQWSLTTPRRAERLRVWVEDAYNSADRLTLHVRAGDPVGVEVELSGMGRVDTTYTDDFAVDVTRGDFELTPESAAGLDDETTYYFALEYECSTMGCLLHLRGEVEGAPNQEPVADAGENQDVTEDDEVTLDGSASVDPDGDELIFLWTQTAGPIVELDGADTDAPSFTAEEPGEYRFELTVTDTEGGADSDSVFVSAAALPEEEDGGPGDADVEDSGPEEDSGPDADADLARDFSLRGGGCACDSASSSSIGLIRQLLAL